MSEIASVYDTAETGIYMWLTFGVIIFAMISYAMERISLEITSLLILIVLLVIFQLPHLWQLLGGPEANILLTPTELLAGFGNPALISVMALLVMGQGLFQSGALEGITERLSNLANKSPLLAVGLILILAMITSAFLNNTPVVLMTIPILATIATRAGITAPRLMMSLSFICILGGMTTLIGSSTNLLVAGVVEDTGVLQIDFFSITVPGAVLAGVGALYVIFVMPYLLKSVAANNDEDREEQTSGKQYILEMRLKAGDKLVGAQPVAGFFPELTGLTLRMVERYGETFLPPFEDFTLNVGDTLVMAATRPELTDALSDQGHPLSSLAEEHAEGVKPGNINQPTLAEVVVAPGSRMNGRSIYQTGFHFETGCKVLGIQRRSRMLRQNLRDIRLEAGDVLLVLGSSKQIQGLRSNRDVLLLEWSASNLPNFAYAKRSLTIFGLTVLLAALNILPIVVAAIFGSICMILGGALNIRQASRSIDLRIFLIIGASLAMSRAMETTGGVAFLSSNFIEVFDGAPPAVMISAFFLLCAITTNILSNNATAVLFAPIALGLSSSLSMAPEPFIFAVIFAANCSFATPISYQTNLLVMTPGGYQFKDFMRAGIPLIFIIWITYSLFAPWYFGLY